MHVGAVPTSHLELTVQSDPGDSVFGDRMHRRPAQRVPDLNDERLRRRWALEASIVEAELADERAARNHRAIVIVLALVFVLITATAVAFIFSSP